MFYTLKWENFQINYKQTHHLLLPSLSLVSKKKKKKTFNIFKWRCNSMWKLVCAHEHDERTRRKKKIHFINRFLAIGRTPNNEDNVKHATMQLLYKISHTHTHTISRNQLESRFSLIDFRSLRNSNGCKSNSFALRLRLEMDWTRCTLHNYEIWSLKVFL